LITEFEQKIENKTILRKQKILDGQERNLALEMLTSEWLTPGGRERDRTHLQNNNEVKPEQLKLSKTDLSTRS
jgi:hypothetical protein